MGRIFGLLLFVAVPSFAEVSHCLVPTLPGVTWNERSVAIHSRPGEGVSLQLGGSLRAGTQLSVGKTVINPDTSGVFLWVMPLANQPDDYDWVATQSDGSIEAVRMHSEWKKPFPGFDPEFAETVAYPPGEWLALSCENKTEEKRQEIERKARRFKLSVFSVSGLFVVADASRYSLSPQVEWTPHFEINGKWESYFSLGASLLRRDATGSFLALEADLVAKYRLYPRFFLGAGVGVHLWLTFDSLSPHLTWVASVPFEAGAGLCIREVFASFGHYFSGAGAREAFKLGARIQF